MAANENGLDSREVQPVKTYQKSHSHLTLDWRDYAIGEHRIFCPQCGDGKRVKNAGLKVDDRGAVLHCFKCSYTESFRDKSSSIRRAPRIQAPRQNEPKHTTLSDLGRELWDSTQELSDVALAYLESRHCVIPPLYGDLRWHPALRHPSGHVGPCLVARITDIYSNEPLSLHKTWVTKTGKADIEKPRLLLTNHAIKNGVIRLWPAEEVGHTLGIAEGVETALSLAHCVQPAWSCVDAGHMKAFPILAGVTQIYIARDNDKAGVDAANTCAARWHQAGRYVEVTQQNQNDSNDVLEGL